MGIRGKGSLERRRKKLKVDEEEIERLESRLRGAVGRVERQRLCAKLRRLNKEAKTQRRRKRIALEEQGVAVERRPTRTIERLRKPDQSIVVPGDEEVHGENAVDEFASYFSGKSTPKLMLTTVRALRLRRRTIAFLKELTLVLPNTFYYKREGYEFKSIVQYATNNQFTDVLVLNQKDGRPSGLYICHLPEGPTSYFRLTGLKLAQDILNGGVLTSHEPEIILNNFDTRLGLRLGRQLASLFPQRPEFEGRRVITFHNQRDFIFFRQHRYIFKGKPDSAGDESEVPTDIRCRLKEIGPRFTLKLRWMHLGTFDSKEAVYEFVWKADQQVDRTHFFI